MYTDGGFRSTKKAITLFYRAEEWWFSFYAILLTSLEIDVSGILLKAKEQQPEQENRSCSFVLSVATIRQYFFILMFVWG
jgi:hypothetical protein